MEPRNPLLDGIKWRHSAAPARRSNCYPVNSSLLEDESSCHTMAGVHTQPVRRWGSHGSRIRSSLCPFCLFSCQSPYTCYCGTHKPEIHWLVGPNRYAYFTCLCGPRILSLSLHESVPRRTLVRKTFHFLLVSINLALRSLIFHQRENQSTVQQSRTSIPELTLEKTSSPSMPVDARVINSMRWFWFKWTSDK